MSVTIINIQYYFHYYFNYDDQTVEVLMSEQP